jgi:hypothetical protein
MKEPTATHFENQSGWGSSLPGATLFRTMAGASSQALIELA